MNEVIPHKNLSIVLGLVGQEAGNGELVLEQDDGIRRLHLSQGELVHLRSDVPGEQFGSWLLRQGILDADLLSQLLTRGGSQRLGVKVIQDGLMIPEERDYLILELQEMIMIHALEHPILRWAWHPRAKDDLLAYDLHFQLHHRHFIWRTFMESGDLKDLVAVLEAETDWTWESRGDLLEILRDLPLTPDIAYALTFLTTEPISFETFGFLCNLGQEAAARLIGTLWALGALALSGGEQPPVALPPAARAELPPVPPPALPSAAPRPEPAPPALAPKPSPAAAPPSPQASWPADLPPSGPRPVRVNPGQAGPSPARGKPELQLPWLVANASTNAEMALALHAEARHLVAQDRTLEAIQSLEQAVRLLPTGTEAYELWLLLGHLRMVNPAWSTRAITALQNASRIRPHLPAPWVFMGEIYHRKGFGPDAATCYLKALKLDPMVRVPPDVDLGVPASDPRKAAGKGMLGSLRTLLGGGRKSS